MRIHRMLAAQVLIGLFFFPVHAEEPAQTANAQDALKFKWAFLLRDENGNAKAADFKDKVTVKQGDALRIYLEPVTSVYLYLYLFDAQKQLRCLFPSDPDLYEKGVKPGVQHLLPGKEKWFMMDEHKGTEKFYLLASARRLSDLEALTKKVIASPKDEELKARLLDEIQMVRRAKGDLSAPVEKGVPIAGTVVAVTRGSPGEGTLTEAPGFYARTLRIEHE